MAKLTFLGAVDGVTGSSYLIETHKQRLLLECGLFQGSRDEEEGNESPFPYDVNSLDAVVISHAHLDHSGRLPRLVKEGYRGPIYMTPPTYDLLQIMLKDAAFLAQRDADWENKRRRRSGKDIIEPLYTIEDVEDTLAQCQQIEYRQLSDILQGVKLCYRDAGHILGSSIVELFFEEGGETRKLVFSGDLGNSCAALLRDPEIVNEADVLLLESTYGDRNHRPMTETLAEFESIITEAASHNGNILIPSFAVGRTQEVIFRLGEMYQAGKLDQLAVFLDSPMAIAATEVYHRYQDVFNREDSAAFKQANSKSLHTFLPVLQYSRTTEDSMALNNIHSGAIIIAGSGMCTGGRIKHHLKHNLWRKESHVIIVGFQARGTPGRALVDGAEKLYLAGEEIVVRASIHTLGGFSAHASQTQLLDWVSHFKKSRPSIYLIHGETGAKEVLKSELENKGFPATIPAAGQTINL